jgi:hypothetical protein
MRAGGGHDTHASRVLGHVTEEIVGREQRAQQQTEGRGGEADEQAASAATTGETSGR